MKIGHKIVLIILGISFAALVLSTVAGLILVGNIRGEVSDVHSVQSDIMLDTAFTVLTGFNEDLVTAFALFLSESVDGNFSAKAKQMLAVRYYLQDSYLQGLPTHSRFEDGMLALAPGVAFEDIEAEFRVIQSARDMIGNVLDADEAAWLYFASESGMMLRGRPADINDIDFRLRYWYLGAVGAGGVYWTDVYTDARTGALTITVSAPVFSGGRLMGVVGSDMFVSDLMYDFLDVDIDIINYIFFINEYGEFILGSTPGAELSDYVSDINVREALISEMLGSHEGLFNYAGVIAGFNTLPSTGWRVGVLADYERINEPILHTVEAIDTFGFYFTEHLDNTVGITLIISMVIALLVIIIVSVFVSRIVANSITKPIDALAQGMLKMSTGDLNHVIEVNTGGEFEMLADSSNMMIAGLREYLEYMIIMSVENERVAADLNVATKIQADMLPNVFPAFPDRAEFDVFALMTPAREVGGDFYDFFLIDHDHLCVVIADVSGKGVPAALFMVIAKTLINMQARGKSEPKDVFTKVNNQLIEGNETSMFVTAWLGVVEISTGKLTYVNAGHNPPLLMRADSGEGYQYLGGKKGFVLAAIDDYEYVQHTIELNKGDMLFLYTDGVTEANNKDEDLYSDERLQSILNDSTELPPKELLLKVKESIDIFAEGAPQFDDITMLGLLIK